MCAKKTKKQKKTIYQYLSGLEGNYDGNDSAFLYQLLTNDRLTS